MGCIRKWFDLAGEKSAFIGNRFGFGFPDSPDPQTLKLPTLWLLLRSGVPPRIDWPVQILSSFESFDFKPFTLLPFFNLFHLPKKKHPPSGFRVIPTYPAAHESLHEWRSSGVCGTSESGHVQAHRQATPSIIKYRRAHAAWSLQSACFPRHRGEPVQHVM